QLFLAGFVDGEGDELRHGQMAVPDNDLCPLFGIVQIPAQGVLQLGNIDTAHAVPSCHGYYSHIGRRKDNAFSRTRGPVGRVPAKGAHRYAYFAFLCGFSLRVHDEKHCNAARIWEDPRRNSLANEYLHATPLLPWSIR